MASDKVQVAVRVRPMNRRDAVWEENQDFRDNKEHIILLMEKLNIIARPLLYTEDGMSVKGQTVMEGIREGKESKVPEKGEVVSMDRVSFTSIKKDKLHQTVLNRCRSKLIKDLNVEVVMMYIQEKELFDDVTIRDINQQTTDTKAISLLIDKIKQRDQDTYETFKDCLIQAQRADLKIMLEEEEEIVAAEMKEKQQDPRPPERKRRPETSAAKKSNVCILM